MAIVGFQEYGVRFGISVLNLPLEEVLAAVCLPHWKPGVFQEAAPLFEVLLDPSADPFPFQAALNGETRCECRSYPELLDNLSREIHHFLAEKSDDPIFIHAGVVNWRGSGVLLPGPSYSGKSQLVQALVSLGATYFSDEYCLIGAQTQRLYPFHRPISLRQSAEIALTKSGPVSLEIELGVSVAIILNLQYQADADWSVRALSSGQMALKLFQNTVAARRLGVRALTVLGAVCAKATCIGGVRGEAIVAARHILELCESLEASQR